MLRGGQPIGAIVVPRAEAGLFPEKHIELLKTFADQAVIAIENVRLFTELQDRNRDLTEALEQQTATSESPARDLSRRQMSQPVLRHAYREATRLCKGYNGTVFRFDGEVLHGSPTRDPPEAEDVTGSVSNRALGKASAARAVYEAGQSCICPTSWRPRV